MLRIFNVVVGFATLAGTCHLFLRGTALLVAVGACALLSTSVLALWVLSDRTRRLKELCIPFIMRVLGDPGAEGPSIVAEVARRPGLRDPVVDVVSGALNVEPDASKRYWAYIALGRAGGRKAQRVLRRGLADPNELARRGAQEGISMLE